jgi:nucleotide-binding universal stress UspA family protein
VQRGSVVVASAAAIRGGSAAQVRVDGHWRHDDCLYTHCGGRNPLEAKIMIALKKILVATDFSEPSAVAVKYAVALAEAFGASLHVLHVIEEFYVHGWAGEGYIPDIGSLRQAMREQANAQLQKTLTPADQERFHAQTVIKWGAPFVEIVRYAKEQGIDLVVMGTHGRGPIAHMLMGSVAEKVVRKAPCPVLTVRHPEHEFVMP